MYDTECVFPSKKVERAQLDGQSAGVLQRIPKSWDILN